MIRLVCPVDPAHGLLLPVKDPTSRWGWHCPHADHDGRLGRHPLGPAQRTRAFFTTDEVTSGQLAPASRSVADLSSDSALWGARERGVPGRRSSEAPDSGGGDSLTPAAAVPPAAAATHPTPTSRGGARVAARSTAPPRAAGLDPFPFAVAPGIPTPGG